MKNLICVTESSPCLIDTLSSALDASHFQLTAAKHAVECLKQAVSAQVVFVDLVLEDMDGLSLIEELRSTQHLESLKQANHSNGLNSKTEHSSLKIVAFLTRSALEKIDLPVGNIESMAIASGADAVFVAPFNLGELTSTVSRLCEIQAELS